MYRFTCKDSHILSATYYPDLKELRVTFRRTGIYAYYGVPEHIWSGFANAISKGEYHERNIRGEFDYAKL